MTAHDRVVTQDDLLDRPAGAAEQGVKRRILIVGGFPTHEALLRLVGAVLVEAPDE